MNDPAEKFLGETFLRPGRSVLMIARFHLAKGVPATLNPWVRAAEPEVISGLTIDVPLRTPEQARELMEGLRAWATGIERRIRQMEQIARIQNTEVES